MKKYIYKIISIIFTSAILLSCSDQLDYEDDGRITMEEVFSGRDKIMGYLNSCYGFDIRPGIHWSSYSDEAEDADTSLPNSRIGGWYSGAATTNTFSSYSFDNPWASLYQGIRKCNVFIDNIGSSKAYGIDNYKVGWEAQARVLRSLYYLQLIKRYGGVPIISKTLETTHDYSKDKRASFSEVVKFIVEDLDLALATPSVGDGLSWEISDLEFGIMTRAIAYAIKSEAVTYAASPLWSDGTYTWEDATEINKEALSQCLNNDYELFNVEPDPSFAQNSYASYFLRRSNDRRAVDKETIYRGVQMSIWRLAGLPSTSGVQKAGPSPSQELVDSYEMLNGIPPIIGYNDDNHLNPIVNSSSGYDPANPYEGRDPRFYASIYYNGAIRNLDESGEAKYNFFFNVPSAEMPHGLGQNITEDSPGIYTYEVTDANVAWARTTPLDNPIPNTYTTAVFSFEYKSPEVIKDMQFLYGPDENWSRGRAFKFANLAATDTWTKIEVDLKPAIDNHNWGKPTDRIRLDILNQNGLKIQIRDIQVGFYGIPQDKVQTYVGGKEGILETSNRNTKTGYYIRKFNNYRSGINNENDGENRIFRLAELYLNFAESAYQSHGVEEKINLGSGISMSAVDAVNAIRFRAGMPNLPTGLSKEEFEKRYRNERRVELAFEGHRFFDVRRWKILNKTDGFVTGMKITQNNSSSSFNYERFKLSERRVTSDKYLMYPIIESEVQKMFMITGDDWQNSGW